MYEVMVVDDELFILEGIASMVDWEKCGTQAPVKASNGREAYDLIQKNPPDIVLTDIKMPGLNGIELIEKVHGVFPDVRFIVLSGYDEFEFAKTAMKCGVKHYLLKPSNEEKIEEAVAEVVQELDQAGEKEAFIESMRDHLNNVIPKAKEQFLREFIINKKFDIKEWKYYQELFGFEKQWNAFRLLGFVLDDDVEYESLFMLKEMLTREMAECQDILLAAIISDRIVLLVEDSGVETLIDHIKQVKEDWENLQQPSFTTSVTSTGGITDLHLLYQEILEGLSHRFYLGKGGIITSEDIKHDNYAFKGLMMDHESLLIAVRSGNQDEVSEYLDYFFQAVRACRFDVQVLRSHCLELYMSLIRQTDSASMEQLFDHVPKFHSFTTLPELETFLRDTAVGIAQSNYKQQKNTQNQLVKEVMEYAKEHLHDEALSISSMASDVFYMNSDYLGKLFKKEIGEKFSTYLMKERMEKAKVLMNQTGEVKMFEVAEKVGFGNNPRYFSQVFKKHTGHTPSEYKKEG
ncbi:response regulator [Salibacterium halotolerans]|uniref:Two-component system, response regulator YesN n=1 Tax=Salibacterium halotolerans TaxID=1884432 RepID=A0A1I5W8T6_9BACI|nr:response regulator [Salibacterium halotolerans]SFQ16083.1 two-component system, response regulator YesN [Salibacterium halotolerans]